MNQRLIGFAGIVVGIALTGVLIWGLIRGINADPALVGALLTAGTTVVGGIAVAGYQSRRERDDEAERLRRDTLIPAYTGFTEFLRTVNQKISRDESVETDPESQAFMAELQDKLLLWASADTVRDWANSLRTMEAGEGEFGSTITAYAGILFAFRRDLGHKDADLSVRDLLRVVITDIDDYLPEG